MEWVQEDSHEWQEPLQENLSTRKALGATEEASRTQWAPALSQMPAHVGSPTVNSSWHLERSRCQKGLPSVTMQPACPDFPPAQGFCHQDSKHSSVKVWSFLIEARNGHTRTHHVPYFLPKLQLFIFILCVQVFCLSVCLCITCIQYWRRSEEGIGFPWTGVTDGCELPYRCWK